MSAHGHSHGGVPCHGHGGHGRGHGHGGHGGHSHSHGGMPCHGHGPGAGSAPHGSAMPQCKCGSPMCAPPAVLEKQAMRHRTTSPEEMIKAWQDGDTIVPVAMILRLKNPPPPTAPAEDASSSATTPASDESDPSKAPDEEKPSSQAVTPSVPKSEKAAASSGRPIDEAFLLAILRGGVLTTALADTRRVVPQYLQYLSEVQRLHEAHAAAKKERKAAQAPAENEEADDDSKPEMPPLPSHEVDMHYLRHLIGLIMFLAQLGGPPPGDSSGGAAAGQTPGIHAGGMYTSSLSPEGLVEVVERVRAQMTEGFALQRSLAVWRTLQDPVMSHATIFAHQLLVSIGALRDVCAYPQCGKVHSEGEAAYQQCSRCHSVLYCGAACQKSHWKTHKKFCGAVAEAAAAAREGRAPNMETLKVLAEAGPEGLRAARDVVAQSFSEKASEPKPPEALDGKDD
eukprot:TRINITY_DN44174_c0_g1_i1.p1 TRINITY_DN44174_c0_g1~~TRINITY_DN44174_c0_g1_i1.p1  ORF type:complete len:454 (+),score=74.42 TRINITY_DN44174_c0_g1_i1:77-1438(+)